MPITRIARMTTLVSSRLATSLTSRIARLGAKALQDYARLSLRHIRKFRGISQGNAGSWWDSEDAERAGCHPPVSPFPASAVCSGSSNLAETRWAPRPGLQASPSKRGLHTARVAGLPFIEDWARNFTSHHEQRRETHHAQFDTLPPGPSRKK